MMLYYGNVTTWLPRWRNVNKLPAKTRHVLQCDSCFFFLPHYVFSGWCDLYSGEYSNWIENIFGSENHCWWWWVTGDSRATSPIPGMLSAKSLSRKRIFALQMSKVTGIESQSRNGKVRPHRLANSLWIFVVKGRTQKVVEQEERSPPHLGLLPSILIFLLIENCETEDGRRVNARWRTIPHNTWKSGLTHSRFLVKLICDVEMQNRKMHIPGKVH